MNAQITYNKAALIAFGLSVVQSIYIYWLDAGDDYVGPFSMNPLHNPTQMCMRPFALICMCLVYDIWNLQRNADYKGVFFKTNVGMHRLYVYLAAMLLLSSIAKPTFAEMFIPTIAFIMLFRLIAKIVGKDKLVKDYFRHCLYMLLCASPSLLYILMAFLLYFTFGGSYGGGEGLVITAFLEVWKMFTENVALSILVGMAFPLFLFLIDARFYLQNDLGIMGVVGYLIGFMEAAFLGEGGDKLSHGDFLWPMMSGMMLMFIVSILHLIDLTAKCDTYEVDMIDCGRTYKLQIFLLDIARTIFVMQVFSGMIFVIKMILG